MADVSRAYEYAKDQYLVMESGDFELLPVNSTHTVEITQFVDLAKVDPINFAKYLCAGARRAWGPSPSTC